MNTIQIRDAEPFDQKTILEFNQALAFETENKVLDIKTLANGVAFALTSNNFCKYFIAEKSGQVIGQVMITYEWSDWRAGQIWWLQSVYVDPDFRKQGVFRAMYNHIKVLAKADSQVRGIRLYVKRNNNEGQVVYKRAGLKPAGYEVFEDEW